MRVAQDLFALIGRLGLGIVLIAHGSQKVFQFGMPQVVHGFEQIGVPLPGVAAWFTALVELIGGVLFVLGLLLPLIGLCVAVVMGGALVLVHLPHGLFAPEGYELVLVIGVAALGLGFNGGRWSLDHAVFGRLLNRRTESTPSTVAGE